MRRSRSRRQLAAAWSGAAVSLVALGALGADGGAPPHPAAFLPPATAASLPLPAGHQYRLQREPGHGWSYDDSRFGARIAEDGSVSFTDHHGTLGLLLPLPEPLPEGTPTLVGTLRGLKGRNLRPAPLPRGASPAAGPVARLSPDRPDPTELCVYPRPCSFQAAVILVPIAGTFDLTDEIMRLGHTDPYRSLKAQFLASTADFRHQMRDRARARDDARALAELRARLDAIARERRPVSERQAEMRSLAEDLDPTAINAAPARALVEARVRALTADAGAP
jgi:hypothetical protein